MSKFLMCSLVALATALGMQPGWASNKQEVSLQAGVPFEQQRQEIEQKLADGKTYAEISPDDRATVRQALDRIQGHLAKAGSIEALGESDKAQVFNDQELINILLTRASEDSRVVCRREQKLGSHRQVTQCETVGERRRARERSVQDLQKAVRAPALKSN